MFFSPGFAPLLFRDNGSVSFRKYRRVDLRQQDGDVLSASATIAWGLSVGNLKPADRPGYLLPAPDDRTVGGRPIVGMLGRDILPEGAVVDLDLPVSILPREVAAKVGIGDADLADDPSVVTKFGRGVLGRRHRVRTLDVGDVRLRQVAFDVENDVKYPMLGLNFFDQGRGTFDFANGKFLFTRTTDVLPARTDLHFDQTKVAHVRVDE